MMIAPLMLILQVMAPADAVPVDDTPAETAQPTPSASARQRREAASAANADAPSSEARTSSGRANARIEGRLNNRVGGTTPTPAAPSYTPLYGSAATD